MWRNRRYILSIMAFFGMFNMYACRVNLSVAIVAMTQNITSEDGTIIEKADFHWTAQQKGIVLSSFYYGYVAIQIAAGVLVKKMSAHIIFGIGTAVPGVITLLTPLITVHLPFWVLIMSRIVIGIFQGVCVPCLMSFWTLWAPPLERARLHGIAVSGAFVGTVVGLPLSGVLGENFGWPSIFYVVGGIVMVWYVIWLILIRERPEKDPFITKFEKEYILNCIGERKETKNLTIPWISIFTSFSVWGLLLAGFGWGWGYVTMLTQLPSFLSDVMDYDLSKSAFLSSLPYLTMTIMTLVAGYTADIILVRNLLSVTQVRKYFISVSLIFQAVFIIIAAYIDNPIWTNICISIGIGLGALTYSGVGINYIDIAPAFAAVLGGIGNTFATIPGIMSPLLTGFIVDVSEIFFIFFNVVFLRVWENFC